MGKIDINSEAWKRYEIESTAVYDAIVLTIPCLGECDTLNPDYKSAVDRFDDEIAQLQDQFGWTDEQVSIAEAECWERWYDDAYPSNEESSITILHMEDDTEPDVEG